MKHLNLVLLLAVVSLFSCGKQAPQLPSNKGVKGDTTTVKMMEINQVLIQKEDSILNKYITKKGLLFKRNEQGFWYRLDSHTQGRNLRDKENCSFRCKMMLLDGTVLSNEKKTITIGKKQTIVGLEEGLKMLHKGETATFIIPWYLAYGMQGNGSSVPPYTSLLFSIELIN